MRKNLAKIAAVTLVLALILIPSSLCWAAGENLIKNGDFSQNDEGFPTYWEKSSYIDDDQDVSIYMEDEEDNSYIVIQNNIENDSSVKQEVAVKPNTLYKLACDIMASGIDENSKGANLSVEWILDTSNELFDTGGQWEEAVLYGRTGNDQDTMTVTLRLGGYGRLNSGYAAFDNVRVEEVTDVPEGFSIADLSPLPADGSDRTGGQEGSDDWEHSVPFWVGIALLYSLIAIIVYKLVLSKDLVSFRPAKTPLVFIIVLGFALILRLVLAVVTKGHPTDMSCFRGWASYSANAGLLNLYNGGFFADYPPGYMYVLYIFGLLGKVLGINSGDVTYGVLIKLPAIAADIAVAYLIFRYADRELGRPQATALGLLFVLAPFAFYNSSVWGQIDSLLMLLIISSFLAFLKKRYILTGVLFALAILVKPQTLMIAPLALAVIIYETTLLKPRKAAIRAVLGCVLSLLAVFILGILPFWFTMKDPFWFAEKYLSTMGQYFYASVNAFNLFFLMGGNWFDLKNQANANDIAMADAYKILGYAFIAMAVAFTIILYITRKERKHIFHIAALVFALIFTFSHSMHERYLIPAVFLLIFAYIFIKDRRLLLVTAGYALTTMINMAYVEGGGYPERTMIPMITALLNVVLTSALAYIAFDHAFWKPKSSGLSVSGEDKP